MAQIVLHAHAQRSKLQAITSHSGDLLFLSTTSSIIAPRHIFMNSQD
jgi:hypothetical protein